ncbi:putative tRNA endonuclease-like domain-containing protein [Enterococcus phage G01]|nr:putative tRNA endonuclease-like domain-containing protein [Enterococcus phage G01]
MGKEAKFSKEVVKYLKSKGALVNVNTANIYDRVGRADIEACYSGYYIALELKTGNYQPDPLQIRYLQEVRCAGGYGLLLRDTLGDLYDLLQYLDQLENREYQGFEDIYYTYEQPDLPEINYDELEIDYD